MELVGLAMHAKTPKKTPSSELTKLTKVSLDQKYQIVVETGKKFYRRLKGR